MRARHRATRAAWPRRRPRGSLGLLFTPLLAGFFAVPARAQELSAAQDACVRSYESAQEHRLKGALQAALPELASCAEGACPAFIRVDCAAWASAVEAELPSLSFSVTSDGRAIDELTLSMDDARIAERVPTRPLSVDPGTHVFLFEAPGMDTVRRTVSVERGQKGRVIQVELRPAVANVASTVPSPLELPPPSAAEHASLPLALDARSLAFGVIGVGGIAGFTWLGLHARSQENKLRSDCAPHCSAGEVSTVRSQYSMADVSLGIGLASLGVGTYLFLSSRAAQMAAAAARFPIKVAVGRGTASATFSGAF